MAKLVVLTQGLAGRAVELTTSKLTIGRLDDNQFAIPEPSVSSHHCEVWLKGDDLVVKDLNSTNGTFVHESQVSAEKEATLKPGQILRLGQVEIRYETGLKQTEQPRQTVRIGEGGTMVVSKQAGFGKKDNKINKIFIGVGVLLAVVTLALLALAFLKLGGSSS